MNAWVQRRVTARRSDCFSTGSNHNTEDERRKADGEWNAARHLPPPEIEERRERKAYAGHATCTKRGCQLNRGYSEEYRILNLKDQLKEPIDENAVAQSTTLLFGFVRAALPICKLSHCRWLWNGRNGFSHAKRVLQGHSAGSGWLSLSWVILGFAFKTCGLDVIGGPDGRFYHVSLDFGEIRSNVGAGF